jgi:hypothetical protein
MRVEEDVSGFTSPPFFAAVDVPLELLSVVAEALGAKCTLLPLALWLVDCLSVLVELCELPGGEVETLDTTDET